jgi:hypothetical protein
MDARTWLRGAGGSFRSGLASRLVAGSYTIYSLTTDEHYGKRLKVNSMWFKVYGY